MAMAAECDARAGRGRVMAGAGDGRGVRRWSHDCRGTMQAAMAVVLPRRWPYVELGEHDGQRWAAMGSDGQ